jgi:acyl-CoA dehydrogenase
MSTVTDAPAGAVPTVADLTGSIRRWLATNSGELDRFRHSEPVTLEATMERDAGLMALLYEGGWTRWGWPAAVGGLGGTPVLRGAVYEELTVAGLPIPEQVLVLETLGPAVAEFVPELSAKYLPPFLRGDEVWCQGFSEPEAGSDLASLRCRAVRDGDEFVISGQKMWSSFGHIAQRCALLARTGSPESRHRGLTMFLVDCDAAGVTTRPIRYAGGRNETGELFFDEVRVPADRVIGTVDGGWAVAMYLLQYERGMYGWIRQAWLHGKLDALAARLTGARRDEPGAAARFGEAYLAVVALRMKTRRTLYRLSAGQNPGPDISVDKLLLARAEQLVLDLERDLEWPRIELADDTATVNLRSEWFYSRAASVYGGAAPIQRSILADHVLHLPKEATGGR